MASEVPTARELAPGDVLDGRYRLVGRLGRGGFGDVWRAEELLPDGAPFREVALKLLVGGVGDAAHWAEEAKMLASFRHPSLVGIHATGLVATAPGVAPVPFVAMELLEGETLAETLKDRGAIPWRRALCWARATAAALDVIHQRGVVHLDLKPANLFVSRDGALKVLDFGIARRAGAPATIAARAPVAIVDAELGTAQFLAAHDAFAATQHADSGARATTARAVVGTPGFMAPEVLELAEPTAAADAYALGVVIVQLCTGRLPHAVDEEPSDWTDGPVVSAWLSQLRAATLAGKMRDLAEDPAGLPRGLLALVRRLLAVDPRQRGAEPGGLEALLAEVWERPHGVPSPPYPGLLPLGPEHEGLLFGRDDEIERLGRELALEPCVVLQGTRGAGKGSLALAGLVPHVARRFADERDDWIAVHVEPGDAPDEALARALERVDPSLRDAGLAELAAFSEARRVGLVLVVDPLDDLLAHSAGERERDGSAARLASLLEALATAHTPGLRALATLDERRAPALLAHPMLGAALRASLRFVGAPSAAAVRELVTGPARAAGVRVVGGDDVAAKVARELRADAGRLPFVALALRAWWATRRELPQGGQALDAARWSELGGVEGALARHADEALAGLASAERALAEELLARLSRTEGTIARWPEEELIEAVGRADETRALLARLVRAKLLADTDDVIALAHPALATRWPELAQIRASRMDRLLFLERLRDGALAWDRSGRHDELLWSGALVQEARAKLLADPQGLVPREREFLAASRKKARRQARRGWAIVALVALGVVAAALGKSAADRSHAEDEARRRAAEQRAYIADLIAKSRRTDDPYHRVALVAEAIAKGSTDGMLPLDLATAMRDLPSAEFTTLAPVTTPSFPWTDRFLLASGPGDALTLADFRPTGSQVIEGAPLDMDPEQLALLLHPVVRTFRPAGDPVVERVAFGFDTAFATRSASGTVQVFRVRDSGEIALAAVAPMRCAGALRVAERAPVLACPTDDGFARWDLAAKGDAAIAKSPFQASAVEISPDGRRVAAIAGRTALVTTPDDPKGHTVSAENAIALARWSPRDAVLALVESTSAEIVSDDGHRLLRLDTAPAPVDARWDPRGVDFGVCAEGGGGAWRYLRSGARAHADGAPPATKSPCAPVPDDAHAIPIARASDVPELAGRDIGPHPLVGGFRLPKGRVVTRDLVLLRDLQPFAKRALAFRGLTSDGSDDPHDDLASVAAVVRDGADVAVQIGAEIRFYGASDDRRWGSRKGNLVRRCDDGHLLAWEARGSEYRVFDARSGAELGTVPRAPGLVVGADARCTVLYTQRLDGALLAEPLAGGSPRTLAVADGYVFNARPSAPREGAGPGLWIAVSSGAIARIDDATSAVRVAAYATPFANAIGDGPGRGDLAYADATGVTIVHPSGAADRVLSAGSGAAWEDLSVSPDGASVLLAGPDRIAVLDLAQREIVGSAPVDAGGRLSPWDDGGSVVAWSFTHVGGPAGTIVPRSRALAHDLAARASNLAVVKGRVTLPER